MRAARLAALLLACALAWPGFVALAEDDPAATLEELLQQAREDSRRRSAENREREQRFVEQRDRQRELLEELEAELEAENRRSDALRESFADNERRLADLSGELELRVGTFGELFGVVRQAAGDTRAVINASMVSAQRPQRVAVAERLARIEGLPGMRDLNDLRVLLLEEMAESGRVARFGAEVIGADGQPREAEVVRVGVFAAIVGDRFLEYRADNGQLQELARQPARRYRVLARELAAAEPGGIAAMAVDPTRGSLLAMLIDTPTMGERLRQGGWIGYVIIALGVLGLLLAGERLIALSGAGRRMRAQLRRPQGDPGNPLGRVLAVYEHNSAVDTETLELKLDEAILREVPRLEKRQGYIKVIAAVAPLLGLLGTVVGMIITFQAIVLFGTGDPQLMADGISQALVTTALGLTVAIPLVFLHSVVASRSRELVEVLEEQSAGLVARHAEAG